MQSTLMKFVLDVLLVVEGKILQLKMQKNIWKNHAICTRYNSFKMLHLKHSQGIFEIDWFKLQYLMPE